MRPIGKSRDDQRICTVLEMFGLDPSDKKAVGKYSLGMKQKLALSMAFLEDPKVLILDEPLSALDADSVQEARKRILEEKERGKADPYCIPLSGGYPITV